ncbi:MAG: class I SAM-dependent methyltransferase [bacterium]|nr:class I SAM-dependent methyltransferase [bacterium]MDZ4299659.1 class I SAM-dependent methyltransferase [Candidatus Sungbacteria bacterium]
MKRPPHPGAQYGRRAPRNNDTSWGPVAEWYSDLLEQDGTYQKELILPNLMRLLQPRTGMTILDLACGPGFFAHAFAEAGATVIAADSAPALIERAKKKALKNIMWHIAPADDMPFAQNVSVDTAVIILAIQNIENVYSVFQECARILKPGGALTLVINHPAFRIPEHASWGWDEEKKIQYRRVEEYMSESKHRIKMHPGGDPRVTTISYHRPLEFYFKALAKAGFLTNRLEEWLSHKKSQEGPRASAENRIRKEIPLFLYLEAYKIQRHTGGTTV